MHLKEACDRKTKRREAYRVWIAHENLFKSGQDCTVESVADRWSANRTVISRSRLLRGQTLVQVTIRRGSAILLYEITI